MSVSRNSKQRPHGEDLRISPYLRWNDYYVGEDCDSLQIIEILSSSGTPIGQSFNDSVEYLIERYVPAPPGSTGQIKWSGTFSVSRVDQSRESHTLDAFTHWALHPTITMDDDLLRAHAQLFTDVQGRSGWDSTVGHEVFSLHDSLI